MDVASYVIWAFHPSSVVQRYAAESAKMDRGLLGPSVLLSSSQPPLEIIVRKGVCHMFQGVEWPKPKLTATCCLSYRVMFVAVKKSEHALPCQESTLSSSHGHWKRMTNRSVAMDIGKEWPK